MSKQSFQLLLCEVVLNDKKKTAIYERHVKNGCFNLRTNIEILKTFGRAEKATWTFSLILTI